jgi:hypothetical protein
MHNKVRRRLKGSEEPEMMLGAILFVIGIAALAYVIFGQLTSYSTAVRTDQDVMASIARAHTAAACLEAIDFSQDYVTTGKGVMKCGSSLKCVKDITTGKIMWGCTSSETMRNSYFPMKFGDSVHMGNLGVSVSA